MKVALVLNGHPPTPAEMALLDGCDRVVCADGGANLLVASGRMPDVIVGDLDSLRADVRAAAERAGVPFEVHPVGKSATDGELALARALAMAPRSLLLLGAHGGSTAMFVANLHLLRRAAERCDACLVGQREVLRFVEAGRFATLPAAEGASLSLLPWEGDAVLTLEGTAWDAAKLRIPRGGARGVSNRIVRSEARVTVHEGTVLVVQAQ